MVKHIVMFKMKATLTSDEKMQRATEVKAKLEQLPAIIQEIKHYEIGLNFSQSPNAYDIVLISYFDNKESLKTYSKHPEHLKVVDFINEVTADRKVVDYND